MLPIEQRAADYANFANHANFADFAISEFRSAKFELKFVDFQNLDAGLKSRWLEFRVLLPLRMVQKPGP